MIRNELVLVEQTYCDVCGQRVRASWLTIKRDGKEYHVCNNCSEKKLASMIRAGQPLAQPQSNQLPMLPKPTVYGSGVFSGRFVELKGIAIEDLVAWAGRYGATVEFQSDLPSKAAA